MFSGTVENRKQFPSRVTILSKYEAEFYRPAGAITVGGKLCTDLGCHSVVVVDDADGVGKYWRKGYVSRLDAEGMFSVRVSEPPQSSGRLKLLPCFENGVNTGNGRQHGLRNAIAKAYRWTGDAYWFEG